MIARDDIVAEARTWIGTRYRHQGRRKGVGVDCIGLVGGVALACGVPNASAWLADPDMHNYARTPDPRMLRAACARFFDIVGLDHALPGDVLLFSLEREPRHFALLVAPGRIVHAYALLAARRVVEQALPIARAQMIGAYRFKGVAR